MQGSHSCDDEVDSGDMTLDSLVTAVPLPGVTWPAGQEVGRPLVLHSLREPQQHSGVVVPHGGSVGRAAGQRDVKTHTHTQTRVKNGHDQPPQTSPHPHLGAADSECLSV